jgi:ABC-2 type transport system permease protein
MNVMNTLIRRELWEHRSIAFAPLAFGLIFVSINLLAALGAVHVQLEGAVVDIEKMVDSLDAARAGALMQIGLVVIAVALNSVMLLVTLFYLLDCLYAERKDRSILFWKSLPVSDAGVVVSKAATAAIAIPAVTLVVFIAVAIAIYLITGLWGLFAGSGLFLAAGPGAILEVTVTHVYALAVQSLWYMPIFGWLLLVSAWARRAVLLWAILPLVAVNLVEHLVFDTNYFAEMLSRRLIGVYPLAFNEEHHVENLAWQFEGEHANVDLEFSDGVLALADPGQFLASPGLWGGLVAAALLIAAAVWVRRYRDET